MEEGASAAVLAYRLETEFFPACVKHTWSIPDGSLEEPQTRIEEMWDIQTSIGEGRFGIVRFERRRLSPTTCPDQTSHHRVRAVKEISKTFKEGGRLDHMKELEVIAKFSQPQVSPSAKVFMIGIVDGFTVHSVLCADLWMV